MARQGLERGLFERMALIRAVEETILDLFSQGKTSGTTHTCIGQEATAVALAENLEPSDLVFCPHRCHGYFLALGGSPESLLAEILGRESGVCRGRGGSQHLQHGRFFSSGIQGGIVGNAVGAALALRLAQSANIVAVILGDGTLGEGLVYESFNFAALHRLPILFVIEDNGYAQTTPVRLGVSGSMTARGEAFGIPAGEIESNDVFALGEVFQDCVDRVRQRGPFLEVVHTYRLAAHSKGDDYRDAAEIQLWREKDPLKLAAVRFADSAAAVSDAKRLVHTALIAAEAAPAASGDLVEPRADRERLGAPFAARSEPFVKSLNRALGALLESDSRVLFLGEDVLDPYGGAFGVSRGLSTRFPARAIGTPISEAGIVSWGVGAALAGARPIVEIMFGDFLALAADQLLNHAAKYRWVSNGRVPLPLVVRAPMGGGRGYGPSHSQSIEKMFLGIPGLTVVAANHLIDPGELLRRAATLSNDPVLFIEHKLLYPRPLLPIVEGRAGNFYVRATDAIYPTVHLSLAEFEPPDAVILAYGGMLPAAIDAAESLLLNHEITADVIAPTLLSPSPIADLAEFAGACPLAVTVEEGQKPSGWGAEIVAGLSEYGPGRARRYVRVAAARCPVPAARELEKRALPNAETVIEAVVRSLK
jgi:2-oxoisovalerate dehydrogenase E1 component